MSIVVVLVQRQTMEERDQIVMKLRLCCHGHHQANATLSYAQFGGDSDYTSQSVTNSSFFLCSLIKTASSNNVLLVGYSSM